MYKFFIFFFNDTATTEIYTVGNTLSLHDALPISDPEVDRRRAPLGRDALDLLARHVAHEPGGHAVEARGRLLGPDDAAAGSLGSRRPGGLERGLREERVPTGAELVAAHRLLDHRERELARDDRDLPRARVLLDPRLGAPAEVGIRHLAERVARVGRPLHLHARHRLLLLDTALLGGDRLDHLPGDHLELVGGRTAHGARDDGVRAPDRVAAHRADRRRGLP